MKAIFNGIIVTETEELEGYAILFDRNIIDICPAKMIPSDAERIDAKGGYVMPGLIDLHIHGGMGNEASYCDLDGLREISESIMRFGTVAWCPTTFTLPKPELEKAFSVIGKAKELSESGEWSGAQVLGANSEGPFISPAKKGAQTGGYISAPDADFILSHKDTVRIVTVAPETEGGLAFIKRVSENSDIVVSLGHTDADFDTASQAYKSGASHTTHLFNAMSPLNHRDPGVVGAALNAKDASCELIADTIHVSPALFEMVARLKGDKLVLITDNIAPAGLEDGEYVSGAEKVYVKGNSCRLSDGNLAGSIYHFNDAIRNFKAHTTLPIHQIVAMASLNPARVIGEDAHRGSLKTGKRADIIVTDRDFNLKKTFIFGKMCYNEM